MKTKEEYQNCLDDLHNQLICTLGTDHLNDSSIERYLCVLQDLINNYVELPIRNTDKAVLTDIVSLMLQQNGFKIVGVKVVPEWDWETECFYNKTYKTKDWHLEKEKNNEK
jgi:hypothetical protein